MGEPSAEKGTILDVRDLVAGYGASEVLHGVSLQVRAGEIVTMVGANGAGKSTLLRSVFGLTDIRAGMIHFGAVPITHVPPHELARRGLAFVPQDKSIFPSLTVEENLMMGGYALRREQLAEGIERVFERFPRLKERPRQKGGTLSGGERQMLAIGRGLMSNPQLLMLDEPSLGLAPKIVQAVFDQIRLINESGTTILLVEQNARRALSIAHRAYVMELGRIRYEGAGKQVLDNPEVQRAYLGG
jgi:branched-chain amino acid transport system ATP-binding protein